jgi:hypothetical protein
LGERRVDARANKWFSSSALPISTWLWGLVVDEVATATAGAGTDFAICFPHALCFLNRDPGANFSSHTLALRCVAYAIRGILESTRGLGRLSAGLGCSSFRFSDEAKLKLFRETHFKICSNGYNFISEPFSCKGYLLI